MSPEQCNPDDPLVQQLQAMPLAAPTVNRDQLFFQAGLAQGKRRGRLLGLAGMIITCVGLGAGVLVGRWTAPDRPYMYTNFPLKKSPPQVTPKKPAETNAPGPKQITPVTEVLDAKNGVVDLASVAGRQRILEDPDLLMIPIPSPSVPVMQSTKSESVEDLLGLPPGSLSETERARWSKALHLGEKS